MSCSHKRTLWVSIQPYRTPPKDLVPIAYSSLFFQQFSFSFPYFYEENSNFYYVAPENSFSASSHFSNEQADTSIIFSQVRQLTIFPDSSLCLLHSSCFESPAFFSESKEEVITKKLTALKRLYSQVTEAPPEYLEYFSYVDSLLADYSHSYPEYFL